MVKIHAEGFFLLTWNDYKTWLSDNLVRLPSDELPPKPGQFKIDSRAIESNDWFVPLKGQNVDGHSFIADVLHKGAAGFLCEADCYETLSAPQKKKALVVKDCLAAFQAIGRGWRHSLKDIKLLAVTGSSGKTTTRELTTAILKKAGPSYQPTRNFNNELGVPISLCQLQREHRYACLEFGARHVGDIAFLNELGSPNIAAVLNIGTAHVGEFGGIENLTKAKLEMVTTSNPKAICVGNWDDERIRKGFANLTRTKLFFGHAKEADIRIEKVLWLESGGMEIQLKTPIGNFPIELSVAHEAYPINIAAAVAMSIAAGIQQTTIQEALRSFSGLDGRYRLHRLDDTIVIDDVYNANPDSMELGLRSLKKSFPEKKLILILGDMRELGVISEQAHENIGKICASQIAPEQLVSVGPMSEGYIAGATKAGFPLERTYHYKNVEELIVELDKFKKNDRVFYLKASNGIGLKKALDRLLSH